MSNKRKSSSCSSSSSSSSSSLSLRENDQHFKRCRVDSKSSETAFAIQPQFGFNDDKYSDIQLQFVCINQAGQQIAESLNFWVSRLLIASRSSFFKSIFDNAPAGQNVICIEVSLQELDLIEPILRLCYGDISMIDNLPIEAFLILCEKWYLFHLAWKHLTFTSLSLGHLVANLPINVIKSERKIFSNAFQQDIDWTKAPEDLLLSIIPKLDALHLPSDPGPCLVESKHYLMIAEALAGSCEQFSNFEQFAEGPALVNVSFERHL